MASIFSFDNLRNIWIAQKTDKNDTEQKSDRVLRSTNQQTPSKSMVCSLTQEEMPSAHGL